MPSLYERAKRPHGRSIQEGVGEIILKQMGGFGKLKAMIGAKDFVKLPKGLGFKWPARQRSKGNYVSITLRADDTYDLEFMQLGRLGAQKTVKTYSGVHAAELVRTFTDQTGLALRL